MQKISREGSVGRLTREDERRLTEISAWVHSVLCALADIILVVALFFVVLGADIVYILADIVFWADIVYILPG